MLLTPSSLISFIASRTVAEDGAETTVALELMEEKRDWIGLERYSLKDGVSRENESNQDNRLRSEIIPLNSSGLSADLINAARCYRTG